eukprot:2192194-Amphidinium_carterae.1
MRCMGAIHVLALNKNRQGDIRPISVPSVWRKLLSSMIVAALSWYTGILFSMHSFNVTSH